MFRELFESVSGIEIFGIVAMMFFLLTFLIVIYWSLKVDRSYIRKMEQMPLEKRETNGE
jgi:hypothetical protein